MRNGVVNCRSLAVTSNGLLRRAGGFACRWVEYGDRRQYRTAEGNRRLWRREIPPAANSLGGVLRRR